MRVAKPLPGSLWRRQELCLRGSQLLSRLVVVWAHHLHLNFGGEGGGGGLGLGLLLKQIFFFL